MTVTVTVVRRGPEVGQSWQLRWAEAMAVATPGHRKAASVLSDDVTDTR